MDMIQLAGAYWKLGIRDTIQRLRNTVPALTNLEVSEANYDYYEKTIVGGHQEALALWEKASTQLVQGHILNGLHLNKKDSYSIPADQWGSRGGMFAGGLARKDVDAFAGDRKLGTLWREQKNADQAMVIPFWDMPKHLSGFVFIAYESQTGDSLLSPYYPLNRHRTHANEGGLSPGIAMLPALRPEHETAIVMMDPRLALRTQIRHLATDQQRLPLPVVAVWPESRPTWVLREMAPTRKLVYVDYHMTAALINHARVNDGWVFVTAQPDLTTFVCNTRVMTVAAWCALAERNAKHWQSALITHLLSLSHAQAESFLHSLQWRRGELSSFLGHCPLQLQTKLESVILHCGRYRVVECNGRELAETARGWEILATNEVILNASVRLEYVIYNQETDQTHYQGFVRFKGEDVPFTAPKLVFEKNPLGWLQNHLIRENKGVLVYTDYCNGLAVSIATKLQLPELLCIRSSYGWDEDNARFVLPKYTIESGGTVQEHRLPMPRLDFTPATFLEKPEELTDEDRELVNWPSPDGQLLWQLAALTLHNLLAKPYNYNPVGGMFVGDHYTKAVQIAQAMGCPASTLPWDNVRDTDRLRRGEETSAWPLVITEPTGRSMFAYRWMETQPHNCLVSINWWGSRCLALKGHWWQMSSLPKTVRPEMVQVARKLVPAFLQHMMTRKMQRYGKHPDSLQRVKLDMSGWLSSMGANPEFAALAVNEIHGPGKGSRTEAFFDIVFQFEDRQLIEYLPPSTWRRAPGNYRLVTVYELPDGGGSVWIPKSEINAILSRNSMYLPVLDHDAVTAALIETNDLIDETNQQGVPGWLIRKETWAVRKAKWLEERRKKIQNEAAVV